MVMETMRRKCGNEVPCSELCSQKKLQPGPGTSLDALDRDISRTLKSFFNGKYPVLGKEPIDSIYPRHLNVHSVCDLKQNGTLPQ